MCVHFLASHMSMLHTCRSHWCDLVDHTWELQLVCTPNMLMYWLLYLHCWLHAGTLCYTFDFGLVSILDPIPFWPMVHDTENFFRLPRGLSSHSCAAVCVCPHGKLADSVRNSADVIRNRRCAPPFRINRDCEDNTISNLTLILHARSTGKGYLILVHKSASVPS